MPAHQNARRTTAQPRPQPVSGLSGPSGVPMRDLLAACAAAAAVSTPPRAPEPRSCEPAKDHREAA